MMTLICRLQGIGDAQDGQTLFMESGETRRVSMSFSTDFTLLPEEEFGHREIERSIDKGLSLSQVKVTGKGTQDFITNVTTVRRVIFTYSELSVASNVPDGTTLSAKISYNVGAAFRSHLQHSKATFTVGFTVVVNREGILKIVTDFTGAIGKWKPVTITATDPDGNPVRGTVVALRVTEGGGTVSPSTVTTDTNGTATSTLTRGNTPGHDYFIHATARGYRQALSRILITKPIRPPDLVVDCPQVSKSILAPGESFTFSATVRNEGDESAGATTLRYYRSSDHTRGTDIGTETVSALAGNGTSDVNIQLTAPTAPGTYTYAACIAGLPNETNSDNNCSHSVRITVRLAPKELGIASGNNQDGTPNSELTDPLVVRVLDAESKGVADVNVTFGVTAGHGKLSSQANEGAITVSTTAQGITEVPFTPTSPGTVTVQASVAGLDPVVFTVNAGPLPAKLLKAAGDNQHGEPGSRLANPFVVEVQDKDGTPLEGISVTFQVTAGGGSLSATPVITAANGRAQTSLTLGSKRVVNTVQASVAGIDTPITFSTSIEPKVLIAADQRPPMYWVDTDAGTLHRLVSEKVENLLPRVRNATSLAIDVAGGKLYWTEKTGERTGRIRSANLDGTNVQLVKDLTSVPLYIAIDVASGRLYLVNGWNKIQRMNLDGSAFQPNLVTGVQAPKGMAVDAAGGKVYWIEQTGERAGRIRSANLDGTNVQLVKALTSIPGGIAIDAVNSKLYITNAYGKVQRLNLDGQNYQPNLITGLKSPMGLAVDSAGGKVYWTEQGSLRRAALNGMNVRDVVTGLGMHVSLVLGTPPVSTGVPAAPTAIASVSGETALLANYPNPFNPETWIPYQLAKDAEVSLTIYAMNGQVVRRLALGHQPAGMYQSKSRAAYWDGRNAFGEPVASGLYFYTFTAGDFTATQKLLIRK